MCIYLKNQGQYKLEDFKGMSYEEIRPVFEKVWDQINSFVPKDSEIEKEMVKRSRLNLQQESTQKSEKIETKQVEEEIVQQEKVMLESSKKAGGRRRKTLARKRGGEKQSESSKKQKLEDELEKEELKGYLNIVPEDEFAVEVTSLATKYPIVSWEYQLLGRIDDKDQKVYKLTRADGSSSYHGDIHAFFRRLDRQDLIDIYRLVQERFQDHSLEGHDLTLWGDLRMLFDPDKSNELWINQ
ncbi:hypothetical protein Tco_0658691 [Tanacetum coccineum]